MDQEPYILSTLAQIGQLSVGQLSRFLFESGFLAEIDLKQPLASLKERGFVRQAVNLRGVVYEITEAGEARIRGDRSLTGIEAEVAAKGEEYRRIFQQEKNYLAQYTEQSSGTVPVFLSIRDEERIVLKISIIVRDVDTAKKICSQWMQNSGPTYDAVWRSIAGGEPDQNLWTGRPKGEEV